MKYCIKLMFVFFLNLFLIKTYSQQKHFIYVESADRQAFAVVLNGKVFSSSDYGYVIIPQLADGTYNFTVSFPMNKFPDQNFKCIINKKDVGYKLENNADKGWALQNMQTQKLIVGNSGVAEDNAFTNMLSDVVDDSNLNKKNLPAGTFKHDTVATANNIIDTTASSASTQKITDVLSNTATAINTNMPLQKISETKLDTGTNMVFVDRTAGTDTIHVFVPSDNTANVAAQPQSAAQNSINTIIVTDTTSTALNQSFANNDTIKRTADNPFYKPNDVNAVTVKPSPQATANHATSSTVKQDCITMISDNDMDKIKRKMFVQHTDNDMAQTALRFVNNKCITTEQVKVLGDLFSSDDGRYNLYDVLYKHVYDHGNYSTLESQIIDPYYKKRFEAMLR